MSSPLRLSPFEQFMLLDDRPAYPMNFFVRVRFSGWLERAPFESAVRRAVARHPLLCAVVRKSGSRWAWAPSDSPPAVRWNREDSAEQPLSFQAIDLCREPGLRLTVDQKDEAYDLWLQVHHACCDALGLLVFLREFLHTWSQERDDSLTETSRATFHDLVGAARPKQRCVWGGFAHGVRRQLAGARRAWRFLTHTPVVATPGCGANDTQPAFQTSPYVFRQRFTAADSSAIRDAATRRGATLNDLLLRDWFLAFDDWSGRHVTATRKGWMRICVPISLRDASGNSLAANAVSMVFVDRRRHDLVDPESLLQSVHREMDQVKRLRLGDGFVRGVRLLRAIPGCLALAMRRERCWATGVLSNLGTVLADVGKPTCDGQLLANGVVLEDIDFMPPLRPLTCVSFGSLTYAGRLGLTLHYDPRVIPPGQAEDLLQTFDAQIRQSLAT